MSASADPAATGDEVDRLRARVRELEAENGRLRDLVVRWRALGLDGWTEPDEVEPLDDLTALKNLLARIVLAPLRLAKRVTRALAAAFARRSPALRRTAIRAQAAAQARTARR